MKEGDSQFRVDIVREAEELLLTIRLSGRVSRQQTLRTLTAARLPDTLHAEPEPQDTNRHTHTSCLSTDQDFIVL